MPDPVRRGIATLDDLSPVERRIALAMLRAHEARIEEERRIAAGECSADELAERADRLRRLAAADRYAAHHERRAKGRPSVDRARDRDALVAATRPPVETFGGEPT
jgi:hypothetical protein